MSKNIRRAVSIALLFAMLFVQCPVLSVQAEQEELTVEAAADSILLSEETQETVEETADPQETEETTVQTETEETASETEEALSETEAAQQTEETMEQETLLLDESAALPDEEEPEQDQEAFLLPMEIPDDAVAPVAEFGGLTLFSDGTPVLPERYDSRDDGLITPVKNQGSYGLCWAFSALAVGESSLISQGLADDTIDLSERHIAYFCMGDKNNLKYTYDPLGNAVGDKTVLSGDYLTAGSNNKYTTFALANWIGAADEEDYPYLADPSVHDASAAADDVAHLTDAYWINARDDKANMKAYIQLNGSIGLSLYYSSSSSYLRKVSGQTGEYASYNGDYTYYNYNKSLSSTNHAITVVGWDDNYPAELFAKSPSNNGAWLCKNSYGTTYGKDGYFWLSYEDVAINTENATAFVFRFDKNTEYDRNYFYDGANGVHALSIPNGGSVANVYKALGPKDEQILAVGVGLYSSDTDYSVQIYTDLSDPACPTSGTPAFATPQKGRSNLAGYHTIALDEAVTVSAGETFAVVITLTKSSEGQPSVFVDDSYSNSWISFTAHTEPYQSFRTSTDLKTWSDLAENGLTARIKAYTVVTNTVSATGLRFAEESVDLVSGDTYTQKPVLDPADAMRYSLRWRSSDTDVAFVNSSGNVTARNPGEAIITAKVRDTDISASYTVRVKPVVKSVKIQSPIREMAPGDTCTPQVEILPAEASRYYTPVFTSSKTAVAEVVENKIHAVAPGTTVIRCDVGRAHTEYTLDVRYSLDRANISVETEDFLGEPIIPKVTVKYGSDTLVKDTDYSLRIQDNTKPGTGTVLVTGMGDYRGTVTVSFPVQIPIPNLRSVKNEASGIRVTWDTVSGAGGYELYRRTESGAWKKIVTVSGDSDTSYLDRRGLSSGKRYDYRICTRISVSGRTYLSESSSELSLYRLTAPSISQIKQVETGFRLTWKAVSGATAYRIMRSDNGAEETQIDYVLASKSPFVEDKTAVEPDVCYTYSVIAEKAVGENSSVSVPSPTRLACHPSAAELKTIKNDTKGITLSWSRSPLATGYVVYRRTDSGKWSKVKTIPSGDELSWTDTRCSSGTRYHYRVLATTKLDGNVYQSGDSATVSLFRLATPRIQKITRSTEGFEISWGKVAGAQAYRIERRDDQGDLLVSREVEASKKPELTDDSEIETGVVYQYFVTAIQEGDTSTQSLPGLACVPETPKQLSAENTAKGIELRWDAAAAADGYVVYRSTNGVKWSKVKTISGGTTLSWTDTKGSSGRRYLYRVAGTAKLGGMSYQGDFTEGLAQYRLAKPVISKVTAANAGGFTVNWKKVTGADCYYLMRSEDDGPAALICKIEGGSVLQYLDSDASGYGKKYTYTVIAEKTDAELTNRSCESDGKSVCRLAPPILSSVEVEGRSAVLRWEPVNLAAGYKVYRSSDGKRWSLRKTITAPELLSWKDTSRSATGTYYYRIVATTKMDGVTYVSSPSNEIRK